MTLVACAPERFRPTDGNLEEYARAAALYRDGNWNGALAAADGLCGRAPRFAAARTLAGKAALFSGDAEGAAVALALAAADLGNREAAIWLVRALRTIGKADEARELTERLLAGDPDDWRILHLEALDKRDGGNDAGYVAFLERSLEAVSGVGIVFLERARLRYASGDFAGADTDIEAALALLPRKSEARKTADGIRAAIGSATTSKGSTP
ncbi:MAG: hypothetical protein NT080_05930 [Spirochaetes bacterium]|nr:hypothetical protein [Spirochaetota bacterium]